MINITGSKYGQQILASAGTTTVTLVAPVLVAGDFSVPRRVGLYTSAGVFKGIAFVRGFLSSTSLSLESAIFDPVDGSIVTQVAGDRLYISKNFRESLTTGVTINGNLLTFEQAVTFGVNNISTSVCFHDEGKTLFYNPASVNESGATTNPLTAFAGGDVSLGHLQDYATSNTYAGCNIFYRTPTFYSGVAPTSTAGKWFMFGGSIDGSDANGVGIVIWNGGRVQPVSNSQVYMNVGFGCDILTDTDGGLWSSNAARQVLINPQSIVTGINGIGIRWGDGKIIGGSVKVTGTDAIAAFGSSTQSNQTQTIGAPAGQFFLVADIVTGVVVSGQGPNALWDNGGGNANANINWVNVLTPERTVARVNGPTRFNWFWRGAYTNLINGSRAIIQRTIDSVVAAELLVPASGIADLTILEQKQSGGGRTPAVIEDYSSWSVGIKGYGLRPVSGNINRSTRSLGSAGTSNIVQFGNFVNQLTDSGVTRAIGAIPATLSTLDDLYDAMHAWSIATVANAQVPTVSTLPITFAGSVLDLGAYNLIVDSTATANFNIVGNNITIKSATLTVGTKFNQFKTNGTVTTSSATITAPFTDSTGNSFLQFDSIDTWQVYSNPTRTTLLGNGTGAELFKFNFVASTSYYLTLVLAGEEFKKTVTPIGTGATLVSLSSTALLTSLNASSKTNSDNLKKVNRNVIKSSLVIPANEIF